MAGYDFSHVNVLVIDDNRHMIAIVRTLLHGFGFKRIIEASDAAQAFEEFRSNPIDLIIVDYRMDPLDGLDFVRLVRKGSDSPNPYVPIILLTAYTERRRVFEARDAGVTEIVAKPVTAKDLYRHIRAVIDAPRPFVRAQTFFGPDRRRQMKKEFGADDRRKKSAAKNAAE